MGIHTALFLKRVSISKSFWSSKVTFNNAIYDASKLFLNIKEDKN